MYQTVMMSHLYYYTDEDASQLFDTIFQTTEDYRKLIESYLNEANGEIDTTVDIMVREEYERKKAVRMEKNAYIANLKFQIKAVAALQVS